MALTQIQSEMIADAAVTTAKIADANITTAKVADANITPAKLSQPLTQGTAQASTSGTSITFTGIPSWVKRITVMFSGVSTNGASQVLVQIGSGSVTTSGYTSLGGLGAIAGGVGGTTSTAGFVMGDNSASAVRYGTMIIVNITGTTWVSSHSIGSTGINYFGAGGGVSPSLSGVLDRVRITTVNGTDTFDAGSINILYE